MAPPAQRRNVPKNDFPKYFATLKTQTFVDPQPRNAPSVTHRTIAWNNVGALIATGATDRIIRIWNPERPGGRAQIELKGHTNEVTKIVFNPMREFELASCSKDGTVRFWDTRSKTCTTKLEPGGDLFSLTWSVDGTEMVSGSKVPDTLTPGFQPREATVLIPSQQEVLTTISTHPSSTPTILEKHRQKLETNQTAFSMAYPPQDLLVTHGDGSVKILDYPSFDTLHTLSSHTSSCSSIAFNPLGNYVAIGGSDAMIALWDTYDWVCKRTFSNANSGKVSGLSWSWDGRYITSSCEDVGSGGGEGKSEGFEIYHAESGDVVYTVPTKTSSVPAVAWHPRNYALAYTVIEGGKSSLRIVGDVGNT